MRRFGKGHRIAVVFILILAMLCVGDAYALRPFMQSSNIIKNEEESSDWKPSPVEKTVYECWQAIVSRDDEKVKQILESLKEGTLPLENFRFVTSKDLEMAYKRYQYSYEPELPNPEAQMAKLIAWEFLFRKVEYKETKDSFFWAIVIAVENVLQHVIPLPVNGKALMLMFKQEIGETVEYWIYIIDSGEGMPVQEVINGKYRAKTGRWKESIEWLKENLQMTGDWAIVSFGEQWGSVSRIVKAPLFDYPSIGTLFAVHFVLPLDLFKSLIKKFSSNKILHRNL
ncbi:MAG: hypothetical protein KKD11_02855 [Candidatus Omnitrophica bacterium]|nr:hypothetical protein [Candidatus Omnitrophota bacterium]